MEISLYGDNQEHVFGVSKEYIKGHFEAKCICNLEEVLKHFYKESMEQENREWNHGSGEHSFKK